MSVVMSTAEPELHTLVPRFVGEISGLVLSSPLPDAHVALIKRAFQEHPVLVFHGQALMPPHLMAFSEYFGSVAPHAQLKYRVPDYPGCSYVTNREPDGSIDEFGADQRAVSFHSDGSFKPVPDAITILHGLEVPDVGGATDFADMYRACEALPMPMKQRLMVLKARHRLHRGIHGVLGPSPRAPEVLAHPGSVHPIIRTHPESGRQSIYVNPVHTEKIEGVSAEESRQLLEEIYAHCTRAEFQYSHRWRRGDVVMWDQRCTLHRAGGGAPRHQVRVLLRTMITTGGTPE
jgi:taurine dioxygenase